MVVIIAPLTSPPAYRPPPLHEWRGGNRWGYFERPDSLRFAFVVIGLRHRRGASIALASYFFRARPVFSGEVWGRGAFERPDSLRFAFAAIGFRRRRCASIALASYFFRARPVFSSEVWGRGAFERPVFPRSACSVICIAVNCSAACCSANS